METSVLVSVKNYKHLNFKALLNFSNTKNVFEYLFDKDMKQAKKGNAGTTYFHK